MTTPISRLTVFRRPWIEYLKENRERWIREAGELNERMRINKFYEDFLLFFLEEEKRRKELKVIEEEP